MKLFEIEETNPPSLVVPYPKAVTRIPGAAVMLVIVAVILTGAGLRALVAESQSNGALSLVVAGLLIFARAVLPRRTASNAHDVDLRIDGPRSEIRINRSDGSFLSMPRSAFDTALVERDTSGSSDSTTFKVVLRKTDRPPLANIDIGLPRLDEDAAKSLQLITMGALAATPPDPRKEAALINAAWERLASHPRVRVSGTSPSERWDPEWSHVDLVFLPLHDTWATSRAVVFKGGLLALATAFGLGFGIPDKQVLPMVAGITALVWATAALLYGYRAHKAQQTRHHARVNAAHLRLSVIRDGKESTTNTWPITEVAAIDVFHGLAGPFSRVALRLQKDTNAFDKRIAEKENGKRGIFALLGLVTDIGPSGLFGRSIGANDLPPDVATDIEVILDTAFARIRQAHSSPPLQ